LGVARPARNSGTGGVTLALCDVLTVRLLAHCTIQDLTLVILGTIVGTSLGVARPARNSGTGRVTLALCDALTVRPLAHCTIQDLTPQRFKT